MSGKRKGQFFIMGAIILCVIFFAGLPVQVIMSTDDTSDITILAENLESEIPRALNLAMLEDGNPDSLDEFIGFARNKTLERYTDLESLWVVTVPDTDNPGSIEVYAGNWFGSPTTLYIIIDSIGVNMNLNDQETDSASFSGVSSQFDIQVSFSGRTWSETLPRDKTNLYSYVSLSRGDNVIVKEITA